MLSTIVSFADNNGVLTWFVDELSYCETQTDVLDFDSVVALSSLICVKSSPLFAIYADRSENSGLLYRVN